MKRVGILFIFSLFAFQVFSQGSGFGYNLNIGGHNYHSESGEYTQTINSVIQNGYIRFHEEDQKWATQLIFGFRSERIAFQNYSDYLSMDGQSLLYSDSDADITRGAWRIGLTKQRQFGRDKKRLCFAVNPGIFYERTDNAVRNSSSDRGEYDLMGIMKLNGVGLTLGAEIRWRWLTLGYRAEKMMGSMLDHDYILNQELSADNSSELRGMFLNPLMNYFVIGINLDFY